MPLPAALSLLSRGIGLIASAFGATAFEIAGLGRVVNGQWNDLGTNETVELNGRRISFSVVAEFPRTEFPAATTADFLALPGRIVTRLSDNRTFRIVGQVQVDELTVRFPLDTPNK